MKKIIFYMLSALAAICFTGGVTILTTGKGV